MQRVNSQEMTIEDYIVEEERELEVRVRHLRKEYGKQLRQYTKTLAEVKVLVLLGFSCTNYDACRPKTHWQTQQRTLVASVYATKDFHG